MAPRSVLYLGNIWILETSRAYRREVEHYLNLMRTTQSGKILCSHINRSPLWMLIVPFNPTKRDPVNAYAYANPDTLADSYPQYYLMWNDLKMPNGQVIKIPAGLGTGKGSTVYVAYHPATWRQLIKNAGMIPAGAGPAQILLHEMTHGYRMMTGKLRSYDQVTGNVAMDDIEEFYAILTANVYGSERGMKSVRADHHQFKRLDKTMSNAENYYDTYKKEIDTWFREQKAFCMEMARIRTHYNPFQVAAIAQKLMTPPPVSMRLPS